MGLPQWLRTQAGPEAEEAGAPPRSEGIEARAIAVESTLESSVHAEEHSTVVSEGEQP